MTVNLFGPHMQGVWPTVIPVGEEQARPPVAQAGAEDVYATIETNVSIFIYLAVSSKSVVACRRVARHHIQEVCLVQHNNTCHNLAGCVSSGALPGAGRCLECCSLCTVVCRQECKWLAVL